MARQSQTLKEVSQHYEMWTQDNKKRLTRRNGWNEITDAYYGKLPDDWPFDTRIVDPRIRTSLIEKNARLLNSKLRGRLVPREGGDVVKGQIHNNILDYQWESANEGGSMLVKLSISDLDTRLYQSKFALIKWKYEEDEEGNVVFEGNEFIPLDIRNCGLDPTASHIKDAKWFQHRTWEHIEDLEGQLNESGKPIFKNLDKLRKKLEEKLGQKRSTNKTTEYIPRVKQLRGLEDRTGEDLAYPIVKICTEYRKDKWITFAPDYKIILREIKNPYIHGKIPIVQLRYYPLQDDALGESEVEGVLPIWRAIQATICGYMDESILKMRPPLKIIENAARVETIEYGPEAQWLVDRQDAIEEMRSSGDQLKYFQTTYQVLVSAFNTAMGDLSQGTSVFDPFSKDPKTATEVKATAKQQNVRDEKNQSDLSEFIKDIMMFWQSNNKQFLFSNPTKKEHILKIVGKEKFSALQKAGMDDIDIPRENMEMVADIIAQNPNMSDIEIEELMDTAAIPKYPVILNPNEKDPTKLKIKRKMTINDTGEEAELSVVPQDIEGTYDYIPDVKSMALGAGEELMRARQNALQTLTNNPTMLQLLQQDGYRPNTKELLVSVLEETGLKDADRFFTKINPNEEANQQETGLEAGAQEMGGLEPNSQVSRLPRIPQTNPPINSEQMVRPDRI